ncbi:MAG: M48 family metalloprotease [Saprospiraceae bacterium]
MKKSNIIWTKTFFLTLAILIISACSKNPITGKKEAFVMSEKREQALGDQSDPSIVASFGLYPDQTLQKFIDSKGQQMARISHRSHLKYEFKILDSPVVNAFALPGGYVYFTRGIMAHFNNEAEFAGVLGHEIGHISGRHSAKQQRNSILTQVGLIAGVVLSKEFANYAESAGQSMQLLMLKNGRDHETQSDLMGVEYSTKIGYDATYMAGFFKTLNRLSGGDEGQRIPTFMSTHPDPLNRYAKVGQWAKEEQKKYPNKTFNENRNQYLRMLEGLIYGEDPRQGYKEGNTFYHPELKFKFPVPTNWQLANSPQQVQMAPKDGKAMMIFTLAPEKTLNEAANNFVTQNKLQKKEDTNLTINGFSAKAIVSEQVDEQGAVALRIVTYFIQDASTIYMFHGLAEPANFISYKNLFRNTMEGFARLTDQSKINVQPDRIHIESINSPTTLSAALRNAGIKSDRLDEMAIVNGMQLSDQLQRGQLIKVLKK